MRNTQIIRPGAVLGILGDGQLGQMIAIAAAYLGYKVAVLGPGGRDSPAGHVAYWAKAWRPDGVVSEELLDEFCRLVSVVMIEWENIPVSLVERIEARGIPVRPSSNVLRIAQDRLFEKELAESLGIPVPTYRNIEVRTQDVGPGRETTDRASILKTRRDGYDGKGQIRIPRGGSIEDAWRHLKYVPCILEEAVFFECEMSVIVARSPPTADLIIPEAVVYGPFENVHENGILRQTEYPVTNDHAALFFPGVAEAARNAALTLAMNLDIHGLLAVEFFVDGNGQVIFNETAPRPHNSGHLTIECSDTSQFEQYVRAACNLPWGSEHFHSSGRMINIIGEEVSEWMDHARQPRTGLHLYGKGEAKSGRKMGHVTHHWTYDDE
ncbi:ATP-grasp domain-containing protein [Candidatus Kaiserbacteria bacterium]|nr:ATP-grasp domain-containing protein [Candidatus Kaiserbacteria bacterium]